jgi:hypothetical protein
MYDDILTTGVDSAMVSLTSMAWTAFYQLTNRPERVEGNTPSLRNKCRRVKYGAECHLEAIPDVLVLWPHRDNITNKYPVPIRRVQVIQTIAPIASIVLHFLACTYSKSLLKPNPINTQCRSRTAVYIPNPINTTEKVRMLLDYKYRVLTPVS